MSTPPPDGLYPFADYLDDIAEDDPRPNDCSMCHERPGTTGVGPLWSGVEICHVCADSIDL